MKQLIGVEFRYSDQFESNATLMPVVFEDLEDAAKWIAAHNSASYLRTVEVVLNPEPGFPLHRPRT